MPLIRIVIPTHNRAFVLHEALGSVRAQTLADFEVIVIDDGSVDDTAAVVQAFSKEDPRVRLLRLAHGGVARARNAGIQEEGAHEYVAFLDSDDLWLPSHLDRAIRILESQPAVGVFFSGVEVDDVGQMWSHERLQEYRKRQRMPVKFARVCEPDVYFLEAAACRRALMFSKFTPKPSSAVVRCRAVHREPWFRTDLMVLEDAEFFLALAARQCHFVFDDTIHVQMRRHGDNLSGVSDLLSARGALRLDSVLRYDKLKLLLCSSGDESGFVNKEIAETAYLLGQNYGERRECLAARAAYRESLRFQFSYRAAKGLLKSMLPASMQAALRRR